MGFSYLKHGGKWGLAWLMLVVTFSSLSSLAAASSATQTQHHIKMIIVAEALKSRHVSPSLALAVAEVESGFRPQVVSHKGAIGVMQIMPATSRQVFGVNPNRLYQPDLNIRLGIRFLDDLIATYDGRVEIALSHYNGGSAVMKNGSARVLPYTRSYVSRVLARSRHYKNAIDKKARANARRLGGPRPLAVQTLTKHAKPNQQTALATHINHVDKWLSVVNELAPRGR